MINNDSEIGLWRLDKKHAFKLGKNLLVGFEHIHQK